MSKREIASLSFKLAGIYVFVQAYDLASTIYLLWSTGQWALEMTSVLLATAGGLSLLFFLLAAGLFFWSGRLAAWVFPQDAEAVAMEDRDAFRIGVLVVATAQDGSQRGWIRSRSRAAAAARRASFS